MDSKQTLKIKNENRKRPNTVLSYKYSGTVEADDKACSLVVILYFRVAL